jgi:glucokinase
MVQPMSAAVAIAIGIDVGGTHLRAGRVGPDGLIGPVLRRASEVDDADALVAAIVRVLDELGEGAASRIPVGLGMAGLVDREGRLRYGPNVGVRETPLSALLTAALGAQRRVRVVNDASAAVVGEHRVGAARGHRDVVMFTLGTGVGGGVISDGRLLEGAHGFAGELGHLVIAEDGRDAPSGVRGTVEAYASGTAIAREAAEAVAAGLAGARAVDAPTLVAAAAAGEPWALAVLERVGARLGVAIASVVAVLDPSIVVIGGGAGDAAATFLLPAARTAFVANLMGAAHRPIAAVVPAELGDDAGVIGAGLLAADLAAAGPAGADR